MNASQDMDTLSTKELGHLFVRHKKLLVIRILKFMFFDIGKDNLKGLGASGHFFPNEFRKFGTELLPLILGLSHGEFFWVVFDFFRIFSSHYTVRFDEIYFEFRCDLRENLQTKRKYFLLKYDFKMLFSKVIRVDKNYAYLIYWLSFGFDSLQNWSCQHWLDHWEKFLLDLYLLNLNFFF